MASTVCGSTSCSVTVSLREFFRSYGFAVEARGVAVVAGEAHAAVPVRLDLQRQPWRMRVLLRSCVHSPANGSLATFAPPLRVHTVI